MALAGWSQLVRYLHPAWRKQRRVIRACENVFDEGEYRLVRIRISSGSPSITDFVPRPDGLLETPRYFTYNIETKEEPDLSGAGRAEKRIVRRYLRRNADHVRHHGRETLRPKQPSRSPTPSPPPERTTDAKLSSSVTLTDQSLWFGKMELHENAILISGWSWSGPTTKRIPLATLVLFETWSERDGTNFRLEIDGGPPIRGRIKERLGLWEVKMDADERVHLKRRFNY